MKEIFKKNIILTFCLVFIWSMAIGQTDFNNTGSGDNKIELLSSKSEITIIKCTVNTYVKESVQTENGKAYIINAKEASSLLIKGAPDLPKITSSLIIPDYAEMQINIIDSKFIEINNIDIAPSKGNIQRNQDPDLISYTYGEVYSQDKFFPENIAKLNAPYILRDYRGQTVIFQPFSYNPVSKVLRIYTEIIVEVSAIPGKKGYINTFERNYKTKSIDSEFEKIYKNHFENFNAGSKYLPIEEQGSLLIISPSKYMNSMQKFVNWKKQKGIPTEIVDLSQIGISASNIKNFVANYYTEKGLTYLLLIGDGEDIPSVIVELPHSDDPFGYSDAAYGYISGDDAYAEVFVGRFSAESVEDVETQVNRTIHYERDITTLDTWFENGVGIASAEGGSYSDDGEADAQHMENIRQDLLSYGFSNVKQIYDPGASASTVSAAINNGVSIIDYIGHGLDNLWGTTYFTNYQVDNLANENKLPFIFSVACLNGNFHGQTCFAESWLRATNNGNPTGAIAMIASTISQGWSPPMDAQDEMIDILIESYENNIKRTFGGIAISGCMHMNDEYGSQGFQETDTWTIFGDPSLNVRTKSPVSQSITHNEVFYMGQEQFTISGDENSYVSLTINNEIIGTGTIIDGTATIDIQAVEIADTLKVTVSGYNKVTYIAALPILPANSPYIVLNNFSLNELDGNNNDTADYNENVSFDVNLKNITDTASGFDAFNVKVKLTSDDPFVTLIDDYASVESISASVDSLLTDAFKVKISNNIPDQHVVSFDLKITGDYMDSTYNWYDKFTIKVNSPKFSLGELIVDDYEVGNNDGVLDPGETANLIIPVCNSGHSNVTDVLGGLSIISGQVNLILNNQTFIVGDLATQMNASVVFNVTASAETELHTFIDLELIINAGTEGQYEELIKKYIIIGGSREYLISNEGAISTCYGYFLDSGGKDENYSNSEDYTMTIMPEYIRSLSKVTFTEFDVESSNGGNCYDELYVYDGEDSNAELIGVYCNANPPDIITATSPSGALTFVFNSDGDNSKKGWNAEISCIDVIDNLVTLNVTDGTDNLTDALISINGRNFITDQNGQVKFYLKNGIYDYNITANGFISFEGKVVIDGTDVTENILLEVEEYNITFNIYDEKENPINATVTFNETIVTAVNGKITFSDLVYQLEVPFTVEYDGYITENNNVDVTNNKTIYVRMNPKLYKVNFTIKNDENPVEGVFITVVSQDEKIDYNTSNLEGVSVFNLIKGIYSYTITGASYDNVEENFTLTDSDMDINVNLNLIETGIDDLYNYGINIYPNPTTGNFFVKSNNDSQKVTISVIDINGKIVLTKNIENDGDSPISLFGQPEGIYLVKIYINGKVFAAKLLFNK